MVREQRKRKNTLFADQKTKIEKRMGRLMGLEPTTTRTTTEGSTS